MYKKYILFMLLGVSMTTVCVVLVTLTRFCMNLRAERVNRHNKNTDSKKIRNLIQGSGAPSQAKNQLANFKRGHAHNPSQGSGKYFHFFSRKQLLQVGFCQKSTKFSAKILEFRSFNI